MDFTASQTLGLFYTEDILQFNGFKYCHLTLIVASIAISSSHHAISTDIPDSLTIPPYHPLLPAGLQGYIGTKLLYVGSSWSSWLCSSMWMGPQEYSPFEFVPTSPAVSCMSRSSNLNSFRDGWWVAVQLLLCGCLPSGLVQYCSQHSCVVAVKLFLHSFS